MICNFINFLTKTRFLKYLQHLVICNLNIIKIRKICLENKKSSKKKDSLKIKIKLNCYNMSHIKEIQSFLHVPLQFQSGILKILSNFSSIKDFHLIKFSKKIVLKIVDILNYPKQQKDVSLYVNKIIQFFYLHNLKICI